VTNDPRPNRDAATAQRDRTDAVARLTAARRAEGDRKAAQVRHALAQRERAGAPFSLAAVARDANVSRGFVYAHPQLLAEVDAARARVLTALGRTGAGAGEAAAAELERLKIDNARLRARLAADPDADAATDEL
jgi:hypothetical protein